MRVVSDGGFVFYIAEVIIDPAFQRQGIGRALMARVMQHIRAAIGPRERTSVCLMAAKGKEAFYARHGFEVRPYEGHGTGMSQWIVNEPANKEV